MFTRKRFTYRLGLLPLIFLYGFITGAAPTNPKELVDSLAPGHEIVTINTRPGVTVRLLLATPKTAPQGAFIVFPGGSAQLAQEDGRIREGFSGQGGSALLAEQGFVAAVVDVPSDQRAGVSDQFRVSQTHTEDIKRVLEFVSQKSPKSIFLMGHSLGTISVAHLAAELKDDRIIGVVLSGSDGGDRRRGSRIVSLATLPLQNITYPVLFVHHREDACFGLHAARQQHNRAVNSRKLGFIEVAGGNAPQDNPCRGGRNPHTFFGQEGIVITAITDWVTGKSTPDRIGQ